jgi:hypothetical protein
MEVENKRAKLGTFRRIVYDLSKGTKKRLRAAGRRVTLWASDIRFIESRFGSGVVSYFVLHRWVFVVNLILALIWFTFVMSLGIADMFQNDNAGWQQFYFNSTSNATVIADPKNAAGILELVSGFFSGAVSES